jgi:hypothetical protein
MSKRTRTKRVTLQSALLGAINAACDAGWTVAAIADGADVPYASLHDFRSGARQSLRLETADRLADWFGMRLTVPTRNIKSPPD